LVLHFIPTHCGNLNPIEPGMGPHA
jgi:hypothetical protein